MLPPVFTGAPNPLTNRIVGFTYDNAGNVSNDGAGNQFDYDAENEQVKHTRTGVGVTSYAYDGNGRRVKRTSIDGTTTIFVYDAGGRLLEEYATAVPGGGGGTSYLTGDHLGSTRVVTDAAGNVKARHDYLPFGEEIPSTAGRGSVTGYAAIDSTRQRFTGKERDLESNLDWYGARYCSPSQGRFTSADSEFIPRDITNPQAWNLYAYTRNNPLRYLDPDGHSPQEMQALIDADVKDLLANKITEEEYWARQNSKGVGALASLGLLFAAYLGPEVYTWALMHPETTLRIGDEMTALSNGNPAGTGPETFAASTLAQGEAKIVQYAASGRAFEKSVLGILGVEKNTARILKDEASGGAAYRIPDILDKLAKALGEIKSGTSVELTSQLSDYIRYAADEGYTFNLYVRPDTVLSQGLVREIVSNGGRVFDVTADGAIVERILVPAT